MIMHARNTLEYETANYNADVWRSGIELNRTNLNDFIGYCVDQKLIEKAPKLEDVFYPTDQFSGHRNVAAETVSVGA